VCTELKLKGSSSLKAVTCGEYLVKAKFHYASLFEAGSELVRRWFEAGLS